MAGEFYGAEADSDEAADGAADGFEKAADFAFSAAFQDDVEPSVGSLSACALEGFEGGFAVFEFDAGGQAGEVFARWVAEDAYCVFAFDLGARVHQAMGEFAVVGQKEQAGGVEIEAADSDPARSSQSWEAVEDCRSAQGVAAGGEFACGFVISDQSISGRSASYQDAIHPQQGFCADSISDLCRLSVDGDAAGGDSFFRFASGNLSALGEDLLQFLLRVSIKGLYRFR